MLLARFFKFSPLIFLLWLLTSCRTSSKVVRDIATNHASSDISVVDIRDSVVIRDSIFVEIRGDTVRTFKFRDRYHVISELRCDTVRDTLTVVDVQTVEKVVTVKVYPLWPYFFIPPLSIALVFMLYSIKRKKSA